MASSCIKFVESDCKQSKRLSRLANPEAGLRYFLVLKASAVVLHHETWFAIVVAC